MTSTAVTWRQLSSAGLASGTLAAMVTTFGGQARARRKARAKILRRLRQLEIARRAAFEHFDEEGGLSLDAELIADLETRANELWEPSGEPRRQAPGHARPRKPQVNSAQGHARPRPAARPFQDRFEGLSRDSWRGVAI